MCVCVFCTRSVHFTCFKVIYALCTWASFIYGVYGVGMVNMMCIWWLRTHTHILFKTSGRFLMRMCCWCCRCCYYNNYYCAEENSRAAQRLLNARNFMQSGWLKSGTKIYVAWQAERVAFMYMYNERCRGVDCVMQNSRDEDKRGGLLYSCVYIVGGWVVDDARHSAKAILKSWFIVMLQHYNRDVFALISNGKFMDLLLNEMCECVCVYRVVWRRLYHVQTEYSHISYIHKVSLCVCEFQFRDTKYLCFCVELLIAFKHLCERENCLKEMDRCVLRDAKRTYSSFIIRVYN